MGWWKCNENGGIDWNNLPSGGSRSGLINAIPTRDTKEDHYNGDTLADIMDMTIRVIVHRFEDTKTKPTKNS